MKKDLDKLLSRTLLTYFTILFVIFVLKMFGLNYFELDLNNKIINNINTFISKWYLENVWYAITLYINGLVVMAIACNDNSKRMKEYVLACLPIFILVQICKTKFNIPIIFMFVDVLYLFILSMCYLFIKKEKIHKYNVKNYFLFTFITILFQFISVGTRNVEITNNNNFIVYSILDIDYLLLNIFAYKLYFLKGGKDLWVEVPKHYYP